MNNLFIGHLVKEWKWKPMWCLFASNNGAKCNSGRMPLDSAPECLNSSKGREKYAFEWRWQLPLGTSFSQWHRTQFGYGALTKIGHPHFHFHAPTRQIRNPGDSFSFFLFLSLFVSFNGQQSFYRDSSSCLIDSTESNVRNADYSASRNLGFSQLILANWAVDFNVTSILNCS